MTPNKNTMLHFSSLSCSLSSCFSPLVMCLAADTIDTQFMWVRSLASCGVEILPSLEEETTQLRNATTIFDFTAIDIDKRTISLDKYR